VVLVCDLVLCSAADSHSSGLHSCFLLHLHLSIWSLLQVCSADRGVPPQRSHPPLQGGYLHGLREVVWGLINIELNFQDAIIYKATYFRNQIILYCYILCKKYVD